jgi:ring-1,2-phenylacetyl-CoA epoxidase subunit PaaE
MAAARFHRLTVADVRRETPDAISVSFAVPPELIDAYRFDPGQYLTLRVTIGGEEVRRSYSICTAPEDGELRIGIRRIEGGAFSTWAHDHLRPGAVIDVMTPTGRFGSRPRPDRARTLAAFAAGSGITPVMSILRAVLAREPDSHFFLFYGNRRTDRIMFREELGELKDRYPARLSVLHILSQESQELPVLNGRLDEGKVRLLLRHAVPAETIDEFLICGPIGMSEGVQAALAGLGVPAERIHVERFASQNAGRPQPRVIPAAPERAICTATLIAEGQRREVPVAEGEAVLDAALRAGLDLPYACKGGMCCTCRARLIEGNVKMAVNYSLQPWELEAGYILTCQSRPQTAHVVIDYDAV